MPANHRPTPNHNVESSCVMLAPLYALSPPLFIVPAYGAYGLPLCLWETSIR